MCVLVNVKSEMTVARPFAVAAEAAANNMSIAQAEKAWDLTFDEEEFTVKVDFCLTDKALTPGEGAFNPALLKKVQEKVNQLVAELTEEFDKAGMVIDPEAFGLRVETLGVKPELTENMSLGIFAEEKTNEEKRAA